VADLRNEVNEICREMEALRKEMHEQLHALRQEINGKLEVLSARIERLGQRSKVLFWLVGSSLLINAVTLFGVAALLART
jgi:type VI protein secretion system component VasF